MAADVEGLATVVVKADRMVDVCIAEGPTTETSTVTFEAEALPGMLASFAGTLALAGLDIVSAMIQLQPGGRVRDTFDVVPLDGRLLTNADAARLAETARDVLLGIRRPAEELRSRRHACAGSATIEPEVRASLGSSMTTGLSIRASDRPGLLCEIASVLTAHGLRTRSLSALSYGGRVHDTFHVVDGDGSPPTDRAFLGSLEAEILEVCRA